MNTLAKLIIASIAVLAFAVTSCAPLPQMTRDEWLTATSRTYDGVTKEEAIAAAEKLLKLADGDDVAMAHNEEGFFAYRTWSIYLVLAASVGTDIWAFKAAPTKTGVKAYVQVNTQAQSITPMATTGGDWTATTMPAMGGSPVMGPAIYDVFWKRMDYLLGKRPDWLTCSQADQSVRDGILWGDNSALCNNFNIEDNLPAEVAAAQPAQQ